MKNFAAIVTLLLSLTFFFGCPANQTKEPKAPIDDIVEPRPGSETEEKTVNQSPSGKQITKGVFSEILSGDFYYIKMKDEKGQPASFMILQAYQGADQLNIENWKSVKGKKIQVTWEDSEEDIPELGGKTKVKKLLEVEVLK